MNLSESWDANQAYYDARYYANKIPLASTTFVVIGRSTKHFTNLAEATEFAEVNAPACIYKRIARTEMPRAITTWEDN